MSIGMFSRASLLSVKALRNYHEAGLLVPALVDPDTGYRIYDPGQLVEAATIYKLRSLDLPLQDINEVLTARDPDITGKVLGEHAIRMQARLDEVMRIVSDLHDATEAPTRHTPPRIETIDHQHVLAFDGNVDQAQYASFLDQAFTTLYFELEHRRIAPHGAGGALYPERVDESEAVVAFVPVAEPFDVPASAPVRIAELPACRVATHAHHGSYDTIHEAYTHLGRWVALNEQPAERPVREHYLVSVNDTDDPDRYITNIQWELQP